MHSDVRLSNRTQAVLIVILGVVLLFSHSRFSWGGTVLQDLAGALKPGQWSEVSTSNFYYTAACNGGTWNILNIECASTADYANQYAQHGAWDSSAKIFYFTGSAHLSGTAPASSETNPGSVASRSVKYSDATNSWSTFSKPPVSSHSYDHLAFNSINNKLYMRQYYTREIYEYTPSTNTWNPTPLTMPLSVFQVAGGLVFARDLGSQGSLVYVDGDWGIYRYDFATASWIVEGGTNGSSSGYWMGSYHNLAEYNPTSKVMLFGGGNSSYRGSAYDNKFYKMDMSEGISPIADPPCSLGILKGLLVPDPTTGNFLAICADFSVSEYVVATNTWRAASIAAVPFAGVGMDGIASVIFAPIPEYGAILFVTYNKSGSSKVHLLRGLSGTVIQPPPSDTTAPSIPSAVSALAASSTQINISWTPSSDNVGVQGYKVYRDGAQVGAAGTNAYSDSNLSPSTAYTYTVAAYDAAGNVSVPSASASATTQSTAAPPPPSGGSDFQTRCAQPGVLKCVGFDNPSDIVGTYGDNHGILPGAATPVLDSTVRASGNSSIKFTIPSNSGANTSGSYFTNFSDNLATQFGQNSDFYIQWRQRFSPEFLTTYYQGGGGWKQTIIGTGDKPGCSASNAASGLCYSSCSSLETVTQNTNQRGFPQMYNSCSGSTSHGPYAPFEQSYGTYDFKMQNARQSPYCLYSQGQTNPKTYFPTAGNCFGYFANEWMTFQVHIKTGPRVNDEFTNSYVELWVAREGQPSEQVFNWGPYNLSAGLAAEDQKFGKIWLLPYNTGKDATQSHPVGYVWYDELIVATSKIADPKTTGSATNPPAAPSSLVLK